MHPVPMSQRTIERDYLWLPVCPGAEKRHVEIFCGQEKAFEMELPCLTGWEEAALEKEGWFYACLPVADYRGRALTFEGAPPEWVASLRCEAAPPAPPACPRPLLHFTPPVGWVNDPNGLVYAQGKYHLYYQHNPYDVGWGNMTWGHAHSTDLFRWTWDDPVLHPDGTGTMFSGCGVRDDANAAGYGPGRLLYYYTAAGGTNRWSAGRPYVQYLALGAGDGMRLEKTGRVMVPALSEGNRDPKVFYHPPTKAYILVLYLSGHDFAIFRSADLLHWEETQRLTLDGGWECPDLLELPVDGGGKKWVFWTADGYYFPGEFDGFRFTPDGPRHCAYAGGKTVGAGEGLKPGITLLPYAAQTISGVEDGRVISIAWLRTPNPPGSGKRLPYTGMMALPAELSLTRAGRMRLSPVRELDALRGRPLPLLPGQAAEVQGAYELSLTLSNGRAVVELPSGRLEADGEAGLCRFTSALSAREFAFAPHEPLSLRLIADIGITEIFAQDDTVAMACETALQTAGQVRCRLDGEGEASLCPLSPCGIGDKG